MAIEEGIQLEFSDDRLSLTTVVAINAALSEIGTGVWPLDLRGAPDDIRQLLMQPTLTDAEAERLRTHFLLPRRRLLEIMAAAGREPNVPGGGALTTWVSNHDYSYPQLWVVKNDVDYTRFDRFHINVSEDGIGVDEVLQVLAGGGVVIRARRHSGVTLTLRLDCPRADFGWLVTYDGGKPHMGSLSGAKLGTKVMVQAIGPSRWALLYRE